MSRTRFLQSACALAALASLAAAGGGDGQPKPPPAVAVIDLSFPGGTVIDYVSALRKAAGEANIVVDPEAIRVAMPAVALRHVSVPAALEVLKGRSFNDGLSFVQLDVAHAPSFSPEERPTYLVQARSGGVPRVAARPTQTMVWTVARLLGEDLTSRKLLSAVETAVEVAGPEPRPDVRFHEESGLLIARGDDAQIDAIAAVIEQLNTALAQRQADQVAALRRALEECRRQQQRPPRPPALRPPDGQEPQPGDERPGDS
jgi:hypothetical protein